MVNLHIAHSRRLKGEGGALGRPWRFLKRHHQVLIKILLVACILFFTILPALFVNDAIGYVPFITVILFLIVSYVYLQVLRRSLVFDEGSLLESCERGSQIEFIVTFRNKAPLVFTRLEPSFYISDLFGGYDTVMPTTMMLTPHEVRDFSFKARFAHIGTYSAGVRSIMISDLLGLFTVTITNERRHMVRVLPRLFDIDSLDVSDTSLQESRNLFQPISTDDMDYAGVREYRFGDPLKTIHWKLSARVEGADYYTRLFETFGNPGITTIIDSYAPGYAPDSLMHIFDGLVESALSINEYAMGMGIDAEVAYLDRSGEAVKAHLATVTDYDRLIEDMQQVTSEAGGRQSLELLTREGYSNHGQGNIAYCTSRLDEELISILIEVKLHRRNPLLFLVVPKELEDDERRDFLRPLRRLEDAQIVYYLVESSDENTEVKWS